MKVWIHFCIGSGISSCGSIMLMGTKCSRPHICIYHWNKRNIWRC